MPVPIEEFPWRKDKKLFDEAVKWTPTKRLYENWAIFMFGYQLGKLASEFESTMAEEFPVDIAFRSEFPDAIMYAKKTREAFNVEFEEFSSLFKEHGHDPEKCDLIVCVKHDWKDCPIDVYELAKWNLHKTKK